ncbi:MAG TPA: ATP-binding protein [Chloroflexia bacterium]|nr:ATP-binding protein [Chloroflexia bacterium]
MPQPFADLEHLPAEHFKLYFYAAVHHLIELLVFTFGSLEAVFERFPFIEGYFEELKGRGLEWEEGQDLTVSWEGWLREWETASKELLPLQALREACGLEFSDLLLLTIAGLVEEDASFGTVFEQMQTPPQQRPTLGLFNGWWLALNRTEPARTVMRRLEQAGLLRVTNRDTPRSEWALQVPPLLWDVMQGEQAENPAPGLKYFPKNKLKSRDELVLREDIQQQLDILPRLMLAGEVQSVLVRSARHNGQQSLIGALAHSLDRGMLIYDYSARPSDENWNLLGPLASLLQAMPVLALDAGPGETIELPEFKAYQGPVGLLMGRQGGLSGPLSERVITLNLDFPNRFERERLWLKSFAGHPVQNLPEIARRFRLTSGNIQRVAKLAHSYAELDGATTIKLSHVRQAGQALNRQALETLATPLPGKGSWDNLAVNAVTQAELAELENRCRYRESLPELVGPALRQQLNAGVRALFSGPSGTGKTLAAQLLAASLQMDLYRLDLASVVNKYIGETEKNLSQVFARAEELDVILLLDEGDSLLTRRTTVQTSNDRYANLETNYLLQRLETYEGILIVTTNAGDRIDGAFQRRMDVVVEFRKPEIPERWAIWRMHLPENHRIEADLLREVVGRCAFTGGQIRNAVLHASLLALQDAGMITSAHFYAAVQREYRKAGSVCPLRQLV